MVLKDLLVSESIPHVREKVFEYLRAEDIFKCLEVCRSWKKLILKNERIWKVALESKIIEIKRTMESRRGASSKEFFVKWTSYLEEAKSVDEMQNCLNLLRIMRFIFRPLSTDVRKIPGPLGIISFVIDRNDLSLYKDVVKFSKDKNPKTESGVTALHHAFRKGKIKVSPKKPNRPRAMAIQNYFITRLFLKEKQFKIDKSGRKTFQNFLFLFPIQIEKIIFGFQMAKELLIFLFPIPIPISI